MRILYVTPESPIFPAGGIGTYIEYAAEAMQNAGHDIFLFTWKYNQFNEVNNTRPFPKENVKIEKIVGDDIWAQFPQGPYNHALSKILCNAIILAIKEFNIDVIEATDYLSPAMMLFQQLNNSSLNKNLIRVTFNHGLLEESYLAGHNIKSLTVACDLAGERQQCRFSDLVIAPSEKAASKLLSYGIASNITVIPEPFRFDAAITPKLINSAFTHLGRVSIAKGIDKTILLANLVNDISPLEKISFIGKIVESPFKEKDIISYIKKRLSKNLQECLHFSGEQNRRLALSLLRPGDIAPNFSLSETFSYSFLETLNYGLLPITEKGSAMAEFFPDSLKKYLFDPQFRDLSEQRDLYMSVLENGTDIAAELQHFNSERLGEGNYALQTTTAYERALSSKYKKITSIKKNNKSSHKLHSKARICDITILMPVYKPTHEFYEAIESLASQTAGIPNLIICDDGNLMSDSIILEYAYLLIPNVKIIRQPNSGLLAARNTLIKHCSTKLAVFFDADDILDNDFLELSLAAYNNGDPTNAVLPMRQNFFESDEKVIRILIGDHVHMMSNDYRMTALCETSVFREIGFDGSRRNGEADDWVFWLEFTCRGFKAKTLPHFVFRYRFKSGSMSWPWSEGQRVGTQLMIKEVLERVEAKSSSMGGSLAMLNMFTRITDL